jgi:hypothetical protein
MKKLLPGFMVFYAVALVAIFVSGCFKDKCTRTYRMFMPVYKTDAEVRANIRSNPSKDIVSPGKIFIKDNYIFLNDVNKGIHVIDNSNPSSPRNVAFIDIPGNVDLAVKGNILYADLYTDLVTLDISDPLNVKTKKIMDNAFPDRVYTNGFRPETDKIIISWVARDTTVAVDCNNGDNFWGCANCGVVESVSSDASAQFSAKNGMAGSMARFSIVQSALYTVGNADMSVYSIATPENPIYVNKVALGWGIETIFPFKDRLLIGSNTGMFIYNINDPFNPSKLGMFTHTRACDPVIADDKYAFVTLRSGRTMCTNASNQLDVLNISDLTAPSLLKTYPMTNPHGLSKDGQTLFVCDGKDGLKIYDASDVLNLKLIRHFQGFESYDVIAFNNTAMVVSKEGLIQYDYSNLNDIKLLSKLGWAN